MDGASEVRSSEREQARLQLDDDVILEVGASWPRGSSCFGAVVWVPPGFEPGQTRDVQLIAYAGGRQVHGFNAEIQGKLVD